VPYSIQLSSYNVIECTKEAILQRQLACIDLWRVQTGKHLALQLSPGGNDLIKPSWHPTAQRLAPVKSCLIAGAQLLDAASHQLPNSRIDGRHCLAQGQCKLHQLQHVRILVSSRCDM
jgi:hypothetical protein